MYNEPTIVSLEPARYQEINDTALTNIELFRAQANASLRQFDASDRMQIKKLYSIVNHPYDFLSKLEHELFPLRSQLDAKHTDDSFKKVLAKHTFQSAETLQPIVDSIVSQSDSYHIDEFIRSANILKDRQVAWSKDFISNTSAANVSLLKSHYVDALLYRHVASTHKITIINAHSGLLNRIGKHMAIGRERRRTAAHEKKRLQFIAARRTQLNKLHNGIIDKLATANWNLAELLALRQEYEKILHTLPTDEVLESKRRLEVFDRVTSDFRHANTTHQNIMNLKQARDASSAVDTLLLTIFDLTNSQKNHLLLDYKEYRNLNEEELSIIQARTQRHNELSQR